MLIVNPGSGKDLSVNVHNTKIPLHIQKKIESANWYLKNDRAFLGFVDSHKFSFDNITLNIVNSQGDIEMLKKAPNEAIIVTFDVDISDIMQISFAKEFLSRSVHKSFDNLASLREISDEFATIKASKINQKFAEDDNLYLIDLSHTENYIKEQVANRVGRWIKFQTRGQVGVFLQNEFGEMISFYDTSSIKPNPKMFKHAPFDIVFQDNSYYFPIANDEYLFGVCILSQSGILPEENIEFIKLALNMISMMVKDF